MIYRALPASGHDVSWDVVNPNLADGGRPHSTVKFRWENEGWTLDCGLGPQRSQVAIRVSAQWGIQQVLLFRDLDDPDLWLATDGAGRWGEVNGAHRTDLDGCHLVAIVDPEKLSVVAGTMRFERIAEHRWRYTRISPADSTLQELIEVDVDEFGLVLDEPEQFIRARGDA